MAQIHSARVASLERSSEILSLTKLTKEKEKWTGEIDISAVKVLAAPARGLGFRSPNA